MYYIMFYVGLTGFVVCLFGAIYIFFKKDILTCIKSVFKLFALPITGAGIMAISSIGIVCPAEEKLDEAGTSITVIAEDEDQQEYIFDSADAAGSWTAVPVTLKINIHDDNGIGEVSVRVGENEPVITDYSEQKEEGTEQGEAEQEGTEQKEETEQEGTEQKEEAEQEGTEQKEETEQEGTEQKEEAEQEGAEQDEETEQKGAEQGEAAQEGTEQKEEVETKDVETCIEVAQSSSDNCGVCVAVSVTNLLGDVTEIQKWVHIDTDMPDVAIVSYENGKGILNKRKDIIFSNDGIMVRFNMSDAASGINDESVEAFFRSTEDNGGGGLPVDISSSAGKDDKGCFVRFAGETDSELYDGYITVRAKDMAGNKFEVISDRIVCCNVEPEVIWNTDYEFGKWTDKDIIIHVESEAQGCGIKKVAYYVSGKKAGEMKYDDLIYKSVYDIRLDKAAEKKNGYTVEVRVTDNCGNESKRRERVYIDKKAPAIVLSGVVTGAYYHDNARIKLEISEVSFNETMVSCDVLRIMDGRSYEENREVYTPEKYTDLKEYVFTKEGEYRVNIAALDGAGNKTVLSEVNFVIDKTPPEIFIGGIDDGSVTNGDVNITFLCDESFYDTNIVSIDVKRINKGKQDTNRLDIFEHNEKKEVKKYTFSGEGTYEITMNAKDKAGNDASRRVLHFTVDKTPPQITLYGTKPYKQWDKRVDLKLIVEDESYLNSKTSLKGSVAHEDGSEVRLPFPEMNMDKKVNRLNLSFNKDGIYTLSVNVRDGAGNVSREDIHFLIDTQAPVISGIEEYDGQYLKELDIKGRKIFGDLTLKAYGLMLNGIEYSGDEKLTQEGRYELLAYAEDELGHRSEASAKFIIDNSAPEVLFVGADDGAVLYEPGEVSWRLYDEEDMITGIVVNDKEYDANLRNLSYNTFGTYEIQINSIDKAGNEGISRLSFEYAVPQKEKPEEIKTITGQTENKRVVTVFAVIGAFVCGGLALLLFKYRKRIDRIKRGK